MVTIELERTGENCVTAATKDEWFAIVTITSSQTENSCIFSCIFNRFINIFVKYNLSKDFLVEHLQEMHK